MEAFRCSLCSKVTISFEGYRCSHCDNDETRESSIPQNPTVIEVRSNATDNNFLHMQNICFGTDCSILPQTTDECNSEKFDANEEKDIKTMHTNYSIVPLSPERKISKVDSFGKDGAKFNHLKDNQRKDHFSELCNKNGNSTVSSNLLENMKIIKESSEDVFRKSSINNDLSENLVIKGIKTLNLNKLFPCNKCGKIFTDESKLKVHLGKHSKKKSLTCDKKYVSEARLIKHYKSHTNKRPIKRNLWDLVFAKNSHLNENRKKHTLDPTVESNADHEKVGKSQQMEQETIDVDDPHEHFQTWAEEKMLQQGEVETCSKDDPQKHFQTSAEEKIFPCTECRARFTREYDFNVHSLRHRGLNPCKCNVCDKEFSSKHEFIKHYNIHFIVRSFRCEICGFRSTQGRDMNHHFMTHDLLKHFQPSVAENIFLCSECGDKFNREEKYREHCRTHGVCRPFMCI